MARREPASELGLSEPEGDKEARFQAVADAVVRALIRGGPESLQYAAIARSAGVSRAWIYKYFGKDTDELVDFVVRLFGDAFADMDVPREGEDAAAWRASLEQGTRKGLRDAAAAPWVMTLYGRYRHDRGRMGEGLRDLQQRYADKLVADMPEALRRDPARARRWAETFMAVRLGVYMQWIDADYRERHSEDEVLADLLPLVDQYLSHAT